MNQKPLHLDRRAFLRGTGVAMALPFLEAMRPATRALSSSSSISSSPTRMVCVGNPLGLVPDAFFPTKTGAGYETTPLLKPLREHRADFTVFSHLDHDVSGGHRGVHAFLSGLKDNDATDWPERNISMDQRAAEHVGSQTRFPSLVVSSGRTSPGNEIACKLSWTRNGVNVPPIDRASEVFRALFLADDAASRGKKARAYDENASVLDAIGAQAKLLERKLGKTDREKLDEYLTSVREVERKLDMSQAWLDKPKPKVGMSTPTDNGFMETLPVMYDLIALALQTDSTRVASLSIPGTIDTDDLGLRGSYHGFSHHGKSDVLRQGLLVIENFQTAQLSRFLSKLKQMKVPDGSPLLDHTMVLFGSGMGNGSSHSNKKLPVLLAGGGFKHGEHKAYPTSRHRRVPLANLYTAMLQRFGVETEKFNTATGTLPEFG